MYDELDTQDYLQGNVAPVFFGSALNNFGVQELLNTFIEIAPTPRGREADSGLISPTDSKFSGFVFKIHANLDQNIETELHSYELLVENLKETNSISIPEFQKKQSLPIQLVLWRKTKALLMRPSPAM